MTDQTKNTLLRVSSALMKSTEDEAIDRTESEIFKGALCGFGKGNVNQRRKMDAQTNCWIHKLFVFVIE